MSSASDKTNLFSETFFWEFLFYWLRQFSTWCSYTNLLLQAVCMTSLWAQSLYEQSSKFIPVNSVWPGKSFTHWGVWTVKGSIITSRLFPFLSGYQCLSSRAGCSHFYQGTSVYSLATAVRVNFNFTAWFPLPISCSSAESNFIFRTTTQYHRPLTPEISPNLAYKSLT